MQENLSCYGSERGTAGKGTPPEMDRLDLLLQETYDALPPSQKGHMHMFDRIFSK